MNRKDSYLLPTQSRVSTTWLAFIFGAVLLGSVHLAWAQNNPTDRAAADTLFEEGKALLKAGNWPSACEKFQRSLALDPSASTYVKTARCHEHDAHFRAAWADYSRALELVHSRTQNDKHARDLEAVVKTAKESLESRVGRVRVQVSPQTQSMNLAIDGEAVEAAALSGPIIVDPGSHTITVTAPGYHIDPAQVTLAEGESREIKLELLPDSAASTPPAIVASSLEPAAVPAPTASAASPVLPPTSSGSASIQSSSGRSQRAVGYVSGSSGVLLLGAAAYFGIRTTYLVHQARSNDHCDSNMACDGIGLQKISEASRAQTTALVFTAVGTAFAGLGIVLLATAPSQKKSAPALHGGLTLSVSPSGSALVGGSF